MTFDLFLWTLPPFAAIGVLAPVLIESRPVALSVSLLAGMVWPFAAARVYRLLRRLAPPPLWNATVHWKDWFYAMRLHREDPATLHHLREVTLRGGRSGRPVVSLRYAHGLVREAAALDPSPRRLRSVEAIDATLALAAAGLSTDEIRTIGVQTGLDAEDILILFEQVPNLTVSDLRRFRDTPTLSRGWARYLIAADGSEPLRPDLAHMLNDLYARHGHRASYYAALDLTDAEQDQMTRNETPLDTLRALVALTADPTPRRR